MLRYYSNGVLEQNWLKQEFKKCLLVYITAMYSNLVNVLCFSHCSSCFIFFSCLRNRTAVWVSSVFTYYLSGEGGRSGRFMT